MARHRADDIRKKYTISDVAGRYGVALKRDGREWLGICPFHGEETPSFTVFQGKDGAQRFQCFGCGEHGDVIDFVRLRTGLDFDDVLAELAGDAMPAPRFAAPDYDRAPTQAVDPYANFVVEYPPAKALPFVAGEDTPPVFNPKRAHDPRYATKVYHPTLVHPYRGRDGRLVGYVIRQEVKDRDGRSFKITPTILWLRNPTTGFCGWSHGAMPRPRPIYGLERLHVETTKQVLIVEGEKCADVATSVLPDLCPISWCGGSKAFSLTNWQPMRGRSAVIWMDNDEPGEAAILGGFDRRGIWKPGLAETLLELECRLKVIRRPGNTRRDGWDIADAVADQGWDCNALLLYMRAEAEVYDTERLMERRAALQRRRDERSKKQTMPPEPAPEARQVDQAKPEPERPASSSGPRLVADNVISLRGQPIDTGDDANWRAQLIYNPDGDKLKPKSFENYRLFITHHERLKGVFAFNAFSSETYVMRPPPWEKVNGHAFEPRPMVDNDVLSCTGYLETMNMAPGTNDAGKAIQLAASSRSFNPVTEYFNALTWDGVPRVAGGRWEGEEVMPWLAEYLGAPDTPINLAFGKRWLISVVARGYQPGCKVDTMLILESPQGFKKSWALRTLGTLNGVSYYTDGLPDMHSKDADMVLQGVLIAEIAELTAFNRTDFNAAKKFISKQIVRMRLPYAKTVQDFPRTAVFAGTVNPGQSGYLRDPTGARRYWPTRVGEIDNKRLTVDRDQIWAEAVALYKSGDQWWLTEEETQMADKVQRLRYEDHPWSARINKFIAGRGSVTLEEITDNLGIRIEHQTALVAKQIIDHLAMSGFKKREVADTTGQKSFTFDAPWAAPSA